MQAGIARFVLCSGRFLDMKVPRRPSSRTRSALAWLSQIQPIQTMKSKYQFLFWAVFCSLLTCVTPAFAQGTAFTYQGQLNDGGNPANGSYDLTFALYGVSSGPGQIAGTVSRFATSVSNGVFTVTLDF